MEEEEEKEAEPPILVDENELKNIFSIVVNGTSGSSVDELIGIHSAFERVVFVHKDDYNKAALLEVCLKFESCRSCRSSSFSRVVDAGLPSIVSRQGLCDDPS